MNNFFNRISAQDKNFRREPDEFQHKDNSLKEFIIKTEFMKPGILTLPDSCFSRKEIHE